LPKLWQPTNCVSNLLNLPIFWLGKYWLKTKQAPYPFLLDIYK
jgi:hypothetical protein